jgi:hypothetical protein
MIKNLSLNCVSPWDQNKPHLKQQEFLNLDRSGGAVYHDHFVGGRGSGKTECGILLLLQGVIANPGLASIWTEPTYKLCLWTFFQSLKRVVPSDFFTINMANMEIQWINGHITHVVSRSVDNPSKESIKGITIAFAIEDEIAYKYNQTKYEDLDGCIRDPKAATRFHACLTTPKLNQYYTLITTAKPGTHRVVAANSFDNPHLPPDWAARLESQMTKRRARQEIYGEWIPQGYAMFPEWSDEDWPAGNMHPHAHDYQRPWYLAFDIGEANGAYMAVQPIAGSDRPYIQESGDKTIWVVTHQWLPRREGSVDHVFPEIMQTMGRKPLRIAVGADVHTRGGGGGSTPMYFITRHMGAVPVTPITGWHADKEVQLSQLTYGIEQRRFCVSKALKSDPADTDRGIVESMHRDHWPDENENHSSRKIWDATKGAKFPTEHIRDAALYGAVAFMFPPSYAYQHSVAGR